MREEARRQVKIIVGTFAAAVIPVGATLSTVRVPVSRLEGVENPTPYGYTVSLLIFLVPVLWISWGHFRRGAGYDRRAFRWCAGIFAGIGAVLDIAFGYHFFEFPNRAATLGIRVPAWDWGSLSFVRGYLPIEEFGFYILGGIFMAATYLWAEQNWLNAHTREDYEGAAAAHPRLLGFHGPLAVTWTIVLVAGIVQGVAFGAGFPGYFVFVMVGGLGPMVLLFGTVKDYVNWPAMAFTFSALILLSVIWEASLGVPYGWWTYQDGEMLGIFIRGWADLPIEAVIVWSVGVWDAVLIYEALRIYFRMHIPAQHRLLGLPAAAAVDQAS